MPKQSEVRDRYGKLAGYVTERAPGEYFAQRLWDNQTNVVPLAYLAKNFILNK